MANCGVPMKTTRMGLPLTGFGQLLDLVADQILFYRAEMIDKQDAVQMVDFMTETSSQESFGLNPHLFSMKILAREPPSAWAAEWYR